MPGLAFRRMPARSGRTEAGFGWLRCLPVAVLNPEVPIPGHDNVTTLQRDLAVERGARRPVQPLQLEG
jgi:hypothetical protein